MKNECLRQFFYHVYASWGGWSRDADEDSATVYMLKKATSLVAYTGTFTHDAIRRTLQWTRMGKPVLRDKILERVEDKMREEIDYSKSGAWRKVGPSRSTLMLTAHVAGEDLHETEIAEHIQKATRCMTTFLDEILPDLILSGSSNWVTIDSLDFITMEDFNCFMVPDLVHTETRNLVWQEMEILPGDTIITDWKTGFSTDVEQLAVYALYLLEQNNVNLRPKNAERILGRSVPLLDPTRTAWKHISREDVEKKREFILKDIEEMTAMLEDGRNKNKSAFPRTEHRGACRNCRYTSFCWQDD